MEGRALGASVLLTASSDCAFRPQQTKAFVLEQKARREDLERALAQTREESAKLAEEVDRLKGGAGGQSSEAFKATEDRSGHLQSQVDALTNDLTCLNEKYMSEKLAADAERNESQRRHRELEESLGKRDRMLESLMQEVKVSMWALQSATPPSLRDC